MHRSAAARHSPAQALARSHLSHFLTAEGYHHQAPKHTSELTVGSDATAIHLYCTLSYNEGT